MEFDPHHPLLAIQYRDRGWLIGFHESEVVVMIPSMCMCTQKNRQKGQQMENSLDIAMSKNWLIMGQAKNLMRNGRSNNISVSNSVTTLKVA